MNDYLGNLHAMKIVIAQCCEPRFQWVAIQAEFIAQFYHAAKKKHFRLKLANKTLKNGSDNAANTRSFVVKAKPKRKSCRCAWPCYTFLPITRAGVHWIV